jgi:hypothetical protein
MKKSEPRLSHHYRWDPVPVVLMVSPTPGHKQRHYTSTGRILRAMCMQRLASPSALITALPILRLGGVCDQCLSFWTVQLAHDLMTALFQIRRVVTRLVQVPLCKHYDLAHCVMRAKLTPNEP